MKTQEIDLTLNPTLQRVTKTSYPDGSTVMYSGGMNTDEAKQTLQMVRNRKLKLVKRTA